MYAHAYAESGGPKTATFCISDNQRVSYVNKKTLKKVSEMFGGDVK